MVDLGPDLRALLAQAQRVALKRGEAVSTGHVVLAMLDGQTDCGRLLEAHGANAVVSHEALKTLPVEATNATDLALERARRIAAQSGHGQARVLHVLLALLQNARSTAHRCLAAQGVSVDGLQRMLEDSLGTPSPRKLSEQAGRVRAEVLRPAPPRTLKEWEKHKRNQNANASGMRELQTDGAASNARCTPSVTNDAQVAVNRIASSVGHIAPAARRVSPTIQTRPVTAKRDFALDPAQFPLLCALGRNLTLDAAEGRIDPVLGRDREIELALDVLARRRANNPLLVGPPGVGKTAIAEGLALHLVSEGSAEQAGRVLVEISAGSLVSGTGVRGALAEKLARLRKEVQASQGRVLLFIDEIHALVSASDGPDDLATELKAALARGELPCVGATTDSEYRRIFERDAALSRRFSRIDVGEPARDAAVAILCGAALHYERFHTVAYARDAIEAAVDLSVRYLPEQHLPDKAIGVIDLAGARVRRRGGNIVDRAAIAAVISEKAGVPVERLLMRDKERLLALEARLSERVIGQEDAIARISEAVRKGAVGLRGARPLGVFLLLGSTGVGKTELAKALSDELFTSSGMTRIDMSEYSEPHAVARLFGAPPGYVGHDEGGQLTEAVRKRPYQLVLLDEIEKAHPDVLLTMLPLLDEGRMTDGRGRTVDFTNTIVVMTSNLGARETGRVKSIGFAAEGEHGLQASRERERVLASVRSAMPPELFNRMDEIVYFPRLSERHVERIATRMLTAVTSLLKREQGVEIEVDPSVVGTLIAAGGYDAELGARPMKRTVGREVESMLATAVLRGQLGPGDRILLVGEGGKVSFRRLSSDRMERAPL